MTELVYSLGQKVADPHAAGMLRAARVRTLQLACVLGVVCLAATVWAWKPMRFAQPRTPSISTPTAPERALGDFSTEGFDARPWQVAVPVAPPTPMAPARPQVQLVGLMHDANTPTARAALYDIGTGQLEVLSQGDTALCGWTLRLIDPAGVTLTRADTPGDIRLEIEHSSEDAQLPGSPGGGGTP